MKIALKEERSEELKLLNENIGRKVTVDAIVLYQPVRVETILLRASFGFIKTEKGELPFVGNGSAIRRITSAEGSPFRERGR